MNIIVTNKYRDLIYGTNIEILKELNGVYKVSQIANSFNSIFYKKIIIDATALENFPKENVLKELSKTFDMDKLILFLPPDNPPPKRFLSFLVSLNIYNFTDNPRGLVELIQKSNTLDNVKEYKIEENSNNNININVQDNSEDDIYSSTGRVVLGVFDIQKGFNSTKLIYMIKKELESLGKSVLSIEVDKRNFLFYRDKDMESITSNKINEFLGKGLNYDVVLIDSNNNLESFTSDIIYLLDPSLFEVNKVLFTDRLLFQNLKGKKIIFVNSMLSSQDVEQFAREANISVYYNLPPLNDRKNNKELVKLLSKLGIIQENTEKSNKKGLFDFFK